MGSLKHALVFIGLGLGLIGCSGSKGGAFSANPFKNDNTSPAVPVSQVETEKLQEVVKTEPVYKIDDAELDMLKKEGIISEADIAQLKSIQ